MVNVFIA